jgi:hypothetical protein
VKKRLLVAHHFGLCMAHMGCATIATPLVAFENLKNSKKWKNRKKTIFFFENHKH